MSEPTSRRAQRSLRLGFGAFGLVAIILAVVFAGGPALHRLVTGGQVGATRSTRATRNGPCGTGRGASAVAARSARPSAASPTPPSSSSTTMPPRTVSSTPSRTPVPGGSASTSCGRPSSPSNDQWSWRTYDKVVAAVRRRVVCRSWASSTSRRRGPGSASCSSTDKCPPGDMAEWQEFITHDRGPLQGQRVALGDLERAQPARLLGDRAPTRRPTPQLLKASYPAVKQADPNAVVVTGGLAPAGVRDADRYPPLDFLKGMYAAGAQGSFDAFGMHPYTYPFTPDEPADYNNYYNLGMYYDVMVANGDPGQAGLVHRGRRTDGHLRGAAIGAPSPRRQQAAHGQADLRDRRASDRGRDRCSGSASATTAPTSATSSRTSASCATTGRRSRPTTPTSPPCSCPIWRSRSRAGSPLGSSSSSNSLTNWSATSTHDVSSAHVAGRRNHVVVDACRRRARASRHELGSSGWRDQHGVAAGDLAERRDVAGHHGHAELHRLEDGQPEALVQAGDDDGGGAVRSAGRSSSSSTQPRWRTRRWHPS